MLEWLQQPAQIVFAFRRWEAFSHPVDLELNNTKFGGLVLFEGYIIKQYCT